MFGWVVADRKGKDFLSLMLCFSYIECNYWTVGKVYNLGGAQRPGIWRESWSRSWERGGMQTGSPSLEFSNLNSISFTFLLRGYILGLKFYVLISWSDSHIPEKGVKLKKKFNFIFWGIQTIYFWYYSVQMLGSVFATFKIFLKTLDSYGEIRNLVLFIIHCKSPNLEGQSPYFKHFPSRLFCPSMTKTVKSCVLSLRQVSLGLVFVLVCLGIYNKIPKMGWLNNRIWQFWKLKVQEQGDGKIGFFWGLSPWLPDTCLLFVYILHSYSSSFYKAVLKSHTYNFI